MLQPEVDEVTVLHGVEHRACIRCTDEEVHRKGLKAAGGMPVGHHLLLIQLTIFGRCFALFCNEPLKNAQKYSVRLLHADRLALS